MFDKGDCLVEVLPYIKKFYSKIMVIKYGGSAMLDAELRESFSKDVSLLKYVGINPIVVHGGGPEIGEALKKLGIESKFYQGLRITDEDTMEVVVMVLAGKVNKEIVLQINKSGGKAVGISGVDAHIIKAKKKLMKDVDLGLVGDVDEVNPEILLHLSEDGYIPVVAPIGVDEDGRRYNINADSVASAIAISLKAEKLIFLTDTDGVKDKRGNLISSIKVNEVGIFINNGTITGGMIPKVLSSKDAVERGVKKVHIINGTKKHSLLEEIFTQSGVGTQIYEEK